MIPNPPVFPHNQIMLIMKNIRNLGLCQQKYLTSLFRDNQYHAESLNNIAITPGKTTRSPANQNLSITDRLNAAGLPNGAESR
jgi:hypothetical protein